jgi:NAD(P)-dependent dehydrogenase (short-subunit alcohol dehydrogenase family)
MATWFITGASRGFGLLVVKEALSRGDNVVASARSAQRIIDTISDGSERLLAVSVDVTERKSIDSAVAAAVDRFGRIDVLMNNAGHGMVGAVEESTERNYRAMFDVNVFGLINVTQAVLPVMREQRSGRIINLSSVAGQNAAAGWGLYAATKHSVEAISDALNAELAPLGISCIAIEPGPFRTDFLDGSSLLTEQNMIGDYEQTAVAATRRWAQDTNHNQLGDPAKFGPIIVDLGHAESVPPRLALGSDTVARIEAKIETLRDDLDAWRTVSESTDLHEQLA